ncbi:MAG: FUSC family protein [Neisseriaceae bacterium]|nr:MAG: FUSC family protein [Neisseriaceae bacterium]
MFKSLDIYTQRYIQIVIIVVIAQSIYQYSHIPHSIWILITITSVYSGFHSTDVIKRANSRLYGTILGIAMVAILWHLIHWDFRLLIILTTLLVAAMVFFSQIPYQYFVIFSTSFSDITKEWSNASNFNLMYYINDRLICTLIGFALCISIEYFWFGRQNLTYLNALQIKNNILKNMERLFNIAKTGTKSNKIFQLTNTLLKDILKLNNLITDLKSEKNAQVESLEIQNINTAIQRVADKIISLNYLTSSKTNLSLIQNLTLEIENELSQISTKLS